MDFSVRLAEPLAETSTGIAWEETSCLLCRGDNWSPLVEAPDTTAEVGGRWFMIVQCRDCGLCFTNPRPTPESMAQFYRSEYDPHQWHAHTAEKPAWHKYVPHLRRWRGPRRHLPLHGEGRLLDFGCGTGAYLVRMRRQGWNAVGVDISDDVVHRLRTEFDLPVLTGSLPHPELADESFDVITMWHSLEHVHDPLEVLRGAYRLLAPGGKLYVATPNIDCLPFRWFGQAWNGLDLPRHLIHFAPWTLRIMLHRGGFRHVKVRLQRRTSWLHKTVRLAERFHPQLNVWQRLLRRRSAVHLLSWYAFLTRQADCMIAEAIKK